MHRGKKRKRQSNRDRDRKAERGRAEQEPRALTFELFRRVATGPARQKARARSRRRQKVEGTRSVVVNGAAQSHGTDDYY